MNTNPFAFGNMMGAWTKAVEDWQASCLALQQTVANIQGQRARAVGLWWQMLPQVSSRLTQAGPTTTAMEMWLQWQGQAFTNATDLACDITAQRAHLLKQWQNLVVRNSLAGLDNGTVSGTLTAAGSVPPASPLPAPSAMRPATTPASGARAATKEAVSAVSTTANNKPRVIYGKMQPSVTSSASHTPTQYMQGTFYPAKTNTTTVTATVPQDTARAVQQSTATAQAVVHNTLPAPTTRAVASPASGFVPAGAVAAEALEHAHVSSTANSFSRHNTTATLSRRSNTARPAKPSRMARGR